jgi:hypothetical protein
MFGNELSPVKLVQTIYANQQDMAARTIGVVVVRNGRRAAGKHTNTQRDNSTRALECAGDMKWTGHRQRA